MIEQIVKDFLTARLGVPIKTEVPERPPGTFVVLERTDGEHSTGIKRCTLAVQSCAPTLLQAAQLDDRAIEAMEAWQSWTAWARAAWCATTTLPTPRAGAIGIRRCLKLLITDFVSGLDTEKAVLSPSTLLYRVCSTSPRDAPLSISWAKLWPVSLCKFC